MNRKHLIALALLTLSLLFLSGCGTAGVLIHTSTPVNGIDIPDTGISVAGAGGSGGLSGGITAFGYFADCGGFPCAALTDGNGNYSNPNLALGFWSFERGGDFRQFDCHASQGASLISGITAIVPLRCPPVNGPSVLVSPNTIDVSQPLPPVMTLSGMTVSAQFGMPQVRIYSEGGTLIASSTAFAVASDGTWVQIATPPALSSLFSGEYGAVVGQVQSDGTLSPISGGGFFITGNDPPPPPDPIGGGCGDGTRPLDCT